MTTSPHGSAKSLPTGCARSDCGPGKPGRPPARRPEPGHSCKIAEGRRRWWSFPSQRAVKMPGEQSLTRREDAMASTRHESIRLFENDLLERLSHVHPITPLVFWGPVALWLLWSGLSSYALPAGAVLALAAAGLFTWTLTEYGLHRFLF